MNATIYEEAKKRIIFALDVADRKQAQYWIQLLKDWVGVFKIGLELFLAEGWELISEIKETTGKKVFVDLKIYDIPATVLAACRQVLRHQADFVTVHCFPAPNLFQEFSQTKLKILGVTVLTSLSSQELKLMGIEKHLAQDTCSLVLQRAYLAKEAGCAGIVCSGQEVTQVKKNLGKDFLVITPGIRLQDNPINDQKRVTTPFEAIKNGSDYLVIGRSLRHSKQPIETVKTILEEMVRGIAAQTEP